MITSMLNVRIIELIKAWFICVKGIIEKYSIAKEDIYNMDETGFQMCDFNC